MIFKKNFFISGCISINKAKGQNYNLEKKGSFNGKFFREILVFP
ncbi:hypothetical protein KADA111694_02825 [Kaistella daneshvariae]